MTLRIEWSDDELADLKILIDRATNTWDKAPTWVWELDRRVTERIENLKSNDQKSVQSTPE